MSAEHDEEVRTRPFADVLVELSKGRIHDEASTTLQQLVQAVAETGKKGSLTLVVTVAKSKAEGQVEVTADVRPKLPIFDRGASLFFVTPDHNLSRDNPEQPHLPLRTVPGAQQPTDDELRKVD